MPITGTRHFGRLMLLGAIATASCGPASEDADEGLASATSPLTTLPTFAASVKTEPLHGYDDAPRAADSDDPAIWVHPRRPERSLVLGTLKNAGLRVYDLAGNVVQTLVPPNRLPLAAEDPPAPGPQPDPGTSACAESESGETFGRYNNVAVQYDFDYFDPLLRRHRRVDVAVLTDRGCDRLRIFAIEPERQGGPLFEITASDAPRAFPKRLPKPSRYQPSGAVSQVEPNPLDDQNTAYGLTLYRTREGELHAFATQRSRSLVAEFELVPTARGVSYRKVREFRFPSSFALKGGVDWTPCREDPTEDPQFEGLVVDAERGILYAAQEVIGVWKLDLDRRLPAVVEIGAEHLITKTKRFGAPYWAVPDDDEFACEVAEGTPPEGVIAVPGDATAGGVDLAADVEGLAIYDAGHGTGYLLISSQGDDTFHVYDRKRPARHLAAFQIEGVGETDGHELVNVGLGRSFPKGLLVVQNGKAPGPASQDPINGYDYDNSTQFEYIGWPVIASPLGLTIATGR